MHLVVLYPLDANTYQIWRTYDKYGKKTDEVWLSRGTLPSEKQKTKHNFSYKTTIWRTYYIKVSKNAERIVGV
jgi:hypothetical protein